MKVIIFILIICNLWLCFMLNSANKKQKVYVSQLNQRLENCQSEISDAIINELKSQDLQLQINENAKDRIFNEFNVIHKYKLIYRINFPYCESCIYPTIEKLEKQNVINKDKILILTAFPSNEYGEEFKVYMKNKSLEVINVSDLDFCFKSEGTFEPFLFILNTNFESSFLFNTKKCNSFVLDKYLELVNTKL